MTDDPQHDGSTELRSTQLPSTVDGAHEGWSGERIGPYRLLEKLGEGGMGEVWLAEQQHPVRRKVALKVIKQGMDTKQVVARFEAERQALAMMDHPAIARVYDAGATPRGRPYFVMEHVLGVPITEHCDRHKLTTRQRLELFMQVCEGVQHAHHKAVIHRDLKPGNVLVSIRDDRPHPKIIDFGVAKATAQKLTDKTLHTQLGVLIGTPAYMSPEQAEMTGQDVDTRTDVYALGVMLYELLVGALPFDTQELQAAGLAGIVRKIREDEPSKPSTRLTTLGEQSAESARRRGTELSVLRRELSGDLDWITMRALEKDRTRRYGSPAELAADIARYLADEPVLASPPSAAYRARKFVRRHRLGVGLAAAGLAVLVAFAGTMAWQAGRIARERDRANREAAVSQRVSEFLTALFEVSDPGEARGNSITARELLDRGAKEIEVGLDDQPEVQAQLMTTMGDVYRKLGLYPEAATLLERAVDQRTRVLGEDHPETLASINQLGIIYWKQGRYSEAEPLYLEALDKLVSVLGADHPETLKSINNLAVLYRSQGRYGEAEPLFLEVLATRRTALGDDHPDTLASVNNMASVYRSQGRYAEAEPLFVEVLAARRRVLGDDHPETLSSLGNLAILYWHQERYDEAQPLFLESLEIRRRVFGDDHPSTLRAMNNLAVLYRSQGRYDEAEPLFRETVATRRRVLGEEHPGTLLSMNNLAEVYRNQGRYAEAETLYRATLEARKRVLGEDHVDTAMTIHHLACLARDTGRHDEARRGFERAGKIWEGKLERDHPDVLENLEQYAELLRSTGDEAGAARLEARVRAAASN